MKQPKPKASASVGVNAVLRPIPPKRKKTPFKSVDLTRGITRRK